MPSRLVPNLNDIPSGPARFSRTVKRWRLVASIPWPLMMNSAIPCFWPERLHGGDRHVTTLEVVGKAVPQLLGMDVSGVASMVLAIM